MDKDQQYKMLCTNVLQNINSWADLYDFMDEVMARVKKTMEPGRVFDALFMMYGFFHAMKELPEEGDIKKLVERMLYILVYESQAKLGVNVTVMTAEEVEKILAVQALEAVAAIAQAAADTETPDNKSKILH